MENIFEYYTLTLTAKSPVFVGSGESVSKKEFCYVPSKDVIRFMNMEKLIDFIANSNDENIKRFEKFMIDDHSLEKLGEHGEKCFTNGLNSFLNLIEMKVADRKKFIVYEIDNDGVFEKDKAVCEIKRFMRGADGRAYIPGSSVKGMIKTALLQQLIRKNKNILPFESQNINYEEKNHEEKLINTLKLKRKYDKKTKQEIADARNAVNSIMRGISISDSAPVSNECFTVCRKIDKPSKKEGEGINFVRECIRPNTQVTFHIKIDKRYFKPVGLKWDFEKVFNKMVTDFDDEYKEFYLDTEKFEQLGYNKDFLDEPYLVLGGGGGYFGKNIIYTRYGFDKGLEKVSAYMAEHGMKNGNDYKIGISPHTLKLTKYKNKFYHMGICSVKLERTNFK